MEERYKFIAAIISGVVTWYATSLFFKDYLPLATVVLITTVVVLRFNAITLTGGFLISLAIELFDRGATEQFRVVLMLIIVVAFVDVALVSLLPFVSGRGLSSSSVGENAFFSLLGIIFAYILQFMSCQSTFQDVTQVAQVNQLWLKLVNCHQQYAIQTISNLITQQNVGIAYWNELARFFLRFLFLWPIGWAALFAALRQSGFKVLQPGRLIGQTFKGIFGITLLGFLTLMVWVVIGVVSVAVLPQDHPMQDLLLLTAIATDIFFSTLGAGWGVTW